MFQSSSSSSSFTPSSHRSEEEIPTIAIAVDKDKGSQLAVKWAADSLLRKNDNLIIVHVETKSFQSGEDVPKECREPTENEMQQLFLPYRGFYAHIGVWAKEVVIHNTDVASALVDFIDNNFIRIMILGASNCTATTREFGNADVPTRLFKNAPDFCSVYFISKGKLQNIRPASSALGSVVSSKQLSQTGFSEETPSSQYLSQSSSRGSSRSGYSERNFSPPSSMASSQQSISSMISSAQYPKNIRTRTKGSSSYQDFALEISDFSPPIQSTDMSIENFDLSHRSDVSTSFVSSQISRDLEAEMRKLKLELKKTMDMYYSACKEAITANEKAKEIDQWKTEEARKLEAANAAQEAALAVAAREKEKARAAIEAVQTAQQLAELEVLKRKKAEMKAIYEATERKKAMDALENYEIQYRKYTIEEIEVATDYFSSSLKIGEGGYGPVYKAVLDHTPVAIKVLRPGMSQGLKQFQREIEVLSYLRHPNMVLLLGACPEYGCLVYEYMENGSLEDRIFRKNNTPPVPWTLRFKIAAEIATALLFLHQTKPQPLVHRDLKPANILLDRYYVSKISDVGLARMVPPSVAESVTQYQMTAAAGTFCYIDPEYQKTGKLGVKSDIYSLGVMLLQIITAKPPMSLSYHVAVAIEKGTLLEMLDPTVRDCPFEGVLSFAKLAVQCCELSKKDRPDLGSVILPELVRLSELGCDNGAVIRDGLSSHNASFEGDKI